MVLAVNNNSTIYILQTIGIKSHVKTEVHKQLYTLRDDWTTSTEHKSAQFIYAIQQNCPHTAYHLENTETSFLMKHYIETEVHKQLYTLRDDWTTSTEHKSAWTEYGDVTNTYNMNTTEK